MFEMGDDAERVLEGQASCLPKMAGKMPAPPEHSHYPTLVWAITITTLIRL